MYLPPLFLISAFVVSFLLGGAADPFSNRQCIYFILFSFSFFKVFARLALEEISERKPGHRMRKSSDRSSDRLSKKYT